MLIQKQDWDRWSHFSGCYQDYKIATENYFRASSAGLCGPRRGEMKYRQRKTIPSYAWQHRDSTGQLFKRSGIRKWSRRVGFEVSDRATATPRNYLRYPLRGLQPPLGIEERNQSPLQQGNFSSWRIWTTNKNLRKWTSDSSSNCG